MEYQQTQQVRRQVKVAVLGNPGIGKTTLLHYFPHFLKPFWEQTKDRFKRAVLRQTTKPTLGIEEVKFVLSENAKLVAWEFSGHDGSLEWLPMFFSKEMVLYLVCYDLSVDEKQQKAQVTKWLNLLSPCFSNPGPRRVILVGLRADKRERKQPLIVTSEEFNEWKTTVPALHDKCFEVSKNDRNSVQKLWNEVVTESEKIMEFVPQVPGVYLTLLRTLQTDQRGLVRQEHFHEHGFGEKCQESIEKGLSYLHSVGDLIWINDLVCTKPLLLAKQLASRALSIEDLRMIEDLGEGRSVD